MRTDDRPATTGRERERGNGHGHVVTPPRRTMRGLLAWLILPLAVGVAVLAAAAPWLTLVGAGGLLGAVGGYRWLATLDETVPTLTEAVVGTVEVITDVFTGL